MAERLCCSKGHRWAPVFAPDRWPPDFRTICPVCGEAPISPNDATATTVRVTAFVAAMVGAAGAALLFVSERTIAFGVIGLILPAVLAMVGVGLWVGRQRTKEMASVAEAMNFAFMAHLLMGWLRAIAPFKLFTLGRDQKVFICKLLPRTNRDRTLRIFRMKRRWNLVAHNSRKMKISFVLQLEANFVSSANREHRIHPASKSQVFTIGPEVKSDQ